MRKWQSAGASTVRSNGDWGPPVSGSRRTRHGKDEVAQRGRKRVEWAKGVVLSPGAYFFFSFYFSSLFSFLFLNLKFESNFVVNFLLGLNVQFKNTSMARIYIFIYLFSFSFSFLCYFIFKF
jgi:hypothetical protein